jgi:TolB-like protein
MRNKAPPEAPGAIKPAPDSADIRAQLSHMLDTRAFKASERLRRLLAHLVTLELEDRQKELTQRHLAEQVFGRGDEFDPERDSIVRVEMCKLRQALELYYSGAGSRDSVLISIPSGTYQPHFQIATAPAGRRAHDRINPVGVAVLRFKDLSPIPDQEWLAHGISEDLNTILSRIPELHITPPHAFPADTDVRDMASRLVAERQVRFALEGSVRCVGDQIRAIARLHDLVRNRQIWSGRFDSDLSTAGLLDIQEEIARHVVAEAADMYTGAIGLSLRSELTPVTGGRLETYETLVRFHHYLHVTSDEAYLAAREALERTALSDPTNPMVLSMLADLRRAAYSLGFTDEPDQIDISLAMLKDALTRAPDCLPCRISLCFALLHRRDKPELLEQVEIILGDSASPASYRCDVAIPLALSGEWDRGCRLIEEQMGDTRMYPHYFQYPFFLRAYRAGDYVLAAGFANAFRPAPFFWQPMLQAAACGKIGDTDGAAVHLRKLLDMRPGAAMLARRSLNVYLLEDDLVEDIIDGLEKAGLNMR